MRSEPFPVRRHRLQSSQQVATPFLALSAADDGRPLLHVDPVGVGRGPLVRGHGPAHVVERGARGLRRLTTQAEHRAGVLPVLAEGDCHLRRLRSAGRSPRWLSGCGNLGFNPGVQAGTHGARFGGEHPPGGWILVDEDGCGLAPEEEPVACPGTWWVSGPVLVRDGRAALSDALTFADPRHLLRFPFVAVAPGIRVDFGHDRLLADADLYRRAAAGRPVELALTERIFAHEGAAAELEERPIEEAALRRALQAKDYREGDPEDGPGLYRFEDGGVRLAYLPGIYPQHVLALDPEGRVHDLLIGGASNRAGVLLTELAEDLEAAGLAEAILLDNGGDVGLLDAETERFALQPAEADRSASWPLTACLAWCTP